MLAMVRVNPSTSRQYRVECHVRCTDAESSDSLRELGATITETNVALLDVRQNLIVRKVTS